MITVSALLHLAKAGDPDLAKPGKPAAVLSVTGAMNSAVASGCFLHATGLSPIAHSRRKELASVGLQYFDVPPAYIANDVADNMPASWGKPSFTEVKWPGGFAWVVGFNDGKCLISAASINGAELSKALRDQFETPGVPWKKLPSGDAPDRYGVAVTPPGKPSIAIVANMVGMDVGNSTRREVVTFEVVPNK